MIDTLLQNSNRMKQPDFWKLNELENESYYLLTLHRPANVDDLDKLRNLLNAILKGTEEASIVFPVHPRTKQQLQILKYSHPKVLQIEPLGYLEFIYMVKHAKAIITDSGGITEEATVLDVPYMTLRNSTEGLETIILGSNELVGTGPSNLMRHFRHLQSGKWKKTTIPPLWDGQTSERINSRLMDI